VKRALAIASTVLGIAAFGYALTVVGVANVRQAIATAGWGFASILLLSAVRELTQAATWALTFTGTQRLSITDAFRARMAGEALSTLLPMGFIVGEPMKAQHVDDHMPFATAFSGLMLEFAFYSASLLLLALGGLALFVPSNIGFVAAVVALSILVLAKPVRRVLTPVWRFVIAEPRRACAIGALEIAYHALGCAEVYLILRCLNAAGATWRSAVAFELMNRGVTVVFKMVPMRLGIDEASAAFMATRVALDPATGVMLALVRKLRALFWTALSLLAIAVRAIRRCAPTLTYRVNQLGKIGLKTSASTARSLP